MMTSDFDFSGLFLVNKPPGPSSHDLVQEMRKKLSLKTIGHAGTLDPMASGLMILFVGKATKLSRDFTSLNKSYRMKIHFGITTDSFDREGKVLKTQNVLLSANQICWESQNLMGEQMLKVPLFSAVKVKGAKLYQYARKGQEVNVPLRPMQFYNLKIHKTGEDFLECEFHCSKGSYVRSWVHQLGERLGCGAVLSELCRKQIGPYSLSQALELTDLDSVLKSQKNLKKLLAQNPAQREELLEEREKKVQKSFIPLHHIFPQWKTLTVSGRDEKLLTHGQISHQLHRRLICERKQADRTGKNVGIRVFGESKDDLISLLTAEPLKGLKIKTCLH